MATSRLCQGPSEPLGDPVVAAIEDALTLVTFSSIRPRRHDLLLAEDGVPNSWAAWQVQPALYALLDRIVRSRSARPSHLATALGLSRSTVSRELRRLEERRLIYRSDFAVQRWRGKVRPIFVPTVEGYNALRQLKKVRRGAVAAALQDWTDEDRLQMARLLRRLASEWTPPTPWPPSPSPPGWAAPSSLRRPHAAPSTRRLPAPAEGWADQPQSDR
jgi:DNA-binding MarR family transcriptional regulator